MRSSQKIGLIAGHGDLPSLLIRKWEEAGLIPVIVALHGFTSPEVISGRISRFFSIGQAGGILRFLKSEGVTELVMVGGLKRPNFLTLRTDFVGLGIIIRLIFRRMGDDSLLKFIRSEIEKFGIQVVGVHKYLPEILCPHGVLGHIQPSVDDLKLISKGYKIAKNHGAEDKGQSVVISPDGKLGFESKYGTNALISSYKNSSGHILVKVSKPQQDLALDMPTIGIKTVELAYQSGFKGIAVESGKTIILEQEKVISLCNEYRIFLIGMSLNDV